MNQEQRTVETEVNENEKAWLIFKLTKQTFAVNCHDVVAIFMVDHEITHMQGYSSHVRGVIDFRGTVLPLLELRDALGMQSFEQEAMEFNGMIDMRIGEHRKWVQELSRCIDEGDEFKLATDPHNCAFGKWYYNYETDNASVAFDLRKIEEPHRKFHEAALEVFGCCEGDEDLCAAQQCKVEMVEKVKNEYMPKVIGLLEDLEHVYKNGYREMCIVIENGQKKQMGLLVDEVTVVEKLKRVDSKDLFQSAFSSSCVKHVAKSATSEKEILVLDRDALFENLLY